MTTHPENNTELALEWLEKLFSFQSNTRNKDIIRKRLAYYDDLVKALEQILDDGGYISDYDENDKPIFKHDPERTDGGCFCHAAALQAINALNKLGETE